VLSTHLLADVEEVCDRVLIIHRGRVIVYGTVAEVAARAAAPRAAQVRVPAEQSDRARQALVEAGVPVLELEVERGRLSDAFLEMTEAS
jgi:ABC-2 type transport system ATP-binding protein